MALAKKSDLMLHAVADRGEPANEHEHAWQLIRDDLFDHVTTDGELGALVRSLAAQTSTPYAETMRRMLGMEGMSESAAHTLFRRIVEHWSTMSKALGRPVHVRVAALDHLTQRAPRYDSRPILVSGSMLERALEEAGSDAVTGLPQRAHFMSLLRHELRQRQRRSVVVAYIDLDRFKAVNDEHGHARGDDVLRTLARCAGLALRQGDVLARIGGDEFAILFVGVGLDEAEAAIGRLRARFEANVAPLDVSFSAGLALADEGESGEVLLGRSDVAMYREKRGRAALRENR